MVFCGVFLCRVVLVSCFLVCCRAVLLVLSLAVSLARCFPLVCWCRAVPCCALLFCAVPCRVWCRRALLRGVLCCVLSWCAVSPGPQARRVVWCLSVLPPPPLLLPPVAAAWPVVVFCPGVRCCVVLLCRLSCGVLLSASFRAGDALLLHSCWLVPCVVACCYWVLKVHE